MTPFERTIAWQLGGDALVPWETWVDGQRWQVRINDYAAGGPIYSLLVDDRFLTHFDEWPAAWTRPSLPRDPGYGDKPPVDDEDPALKAEYELEGERYKNLK